MKKQKYDMFGNRKEFVNKSEYLAIISLKKKYAKQLQDIQMSKKCYGDKVRDVLKIGITTNTVYARKLIDTQV